MSKSYGGYLLSFKGAILLDHEETGDGFSVDPPPDALSLFKTPERIWIVICKAIESKESECKLAIEKAASTDQDGLSLILEIESDLIGSQRFVLPARRVSKGDEHTVLKNTVATLK